MDSSSSGSFQHFFLRGVGGTWRRFISRWFPLFFIHERCCCAPAHRSRPCCFSKLMRHYGGRRRCLQSQINETCLEPSGGLSTQPCLDGPSLCTNTFKVMHFKRIRRATRPHDWLVMQEQAILNDGGSFWGQERSNASPMQTHPQVCLKMFIS